MRAVISIFGIYFGFRERLNSKIRRMTEDDIGCWPPHSQAQRGLAHLYTRTSRGRAVGLKVS